MRSAMLADMLERIRWNEYRIDSVTVVRNGRLVLNAYFNARWVGRRHAVYSVTKSVVSALVGIAIDKGLIADVKTPVLRFFPNRTVANLDARKRAMTLEHLLTMTTGLKCRDSYRHGWADFAKMHQSADWAQFVLDLPMEAAPGTRFNYCNGASFLLSAILTKVSKTSTLDFARKHLFQPLGIQDVSWSTSSRRISNGCCGLSLRPRDMAKFGWLFLNNGRWKGRPVISAAWVARSTRRHVGADLFDGYGYQWWRDARGYFMAVGYKGQRVFVVPQKDMVVVFTGNLVGSTSFAARTLLDKYIIPAAKSETPLPANTKQQARLAALVAASTKAGDRGVTANRRHYWQKEGDGTAHKGLFVRRQAPAFRFRYPLSSQRDETLSATEIMRMRTPFGVVFSVSLQDIPNGVGLGNAGPAAYAARLRKSGSQVRIVSNVQTALQDGSPAFRTEVRWRSRGFNIRTIAVSAYRERKWVLITTHHRSDTSVADKILGSLVFQKAK